MCAYGQCTSCDQVLSGTNLNTTTNNEIWCITSTPSGNVNMNINHDNIQVLVCVDNVTFNGFNINGGIDNFTIESWGDNTNLNSVSVSEDLFTFIVHGSGADVNGGNFNSESRFEVTDGGDLSLNFGLNPGSPINIFVDSNSILTTQSITSNNGGVIDIRPGAIMNVNGTLMFNNPTTIKNQNELNISNDMVMQGGANAFRNLCGESSVNVGGEFRVDAGSLINSGTINTNNFRFNNGGPLNFDEGASLNVTGNVEAINVTNGFNYSGSAGECATFSVNAISNWNNSMTLDNELYYCGPASGSKPGSATVGCGCASTVTNCLSGPMPVKLLHFSAEDFHGIVELNWSTIEEENNSHFEILRSMDGYSWELIGAVSGQGNSTELNNYVYPDENSILSSTIYYRLRQVDFDGSFYYSEILSVKRDAGFHLYAYPNPSSNGEVHLKISHSEGAETLLLLHDALGRELYSKIVVHEEGDVIFALHEEVDLTPGVYLIVASSNEKLHQEKLVVR